MGNTKMALSKENYYFIIGGCILVFLGFVLMAGGGSEDTAVFDENEMFSFRRITLAPFMVMAGYGVILFGILKKPKQAEEIQIEEKEGELKDSSEVIDSPDQK